MTQQERHGEYVWSRYINLALHRGGDLFQLRGVQLVLRDELPRRTLRIRVVLAVLQALEVA